MKKIVLIALVSLISMVSKAQQTIDVFKNVELPPMDGITLVVVDQAEPYVYAKPNGKRRSYNFGAPGELIQLNGKAMYGVKMHPTGWAYVFSASESGFISPKTFHKAKLTPFKEWMFNTAEAVVKRPLEETWRIAVHQGTGLALKESGTTGRDDKRIMHIGRIKDNSLFVPLYCETVKIIYQENVSTVKVMAKQGEQFPYKEIIYGKKYAIETNRGIRLNLEILPLDALNKIFLPIDENAGEYGTLGKYRAIVKDWKDIEYSQWDGIDYYNEAVNAELMSAPYVNEQTAIAAHHTPIPTPNNNTPEDGNQIGDNNGNPENPDNDSIISQKRNFVEFNIIEFASQMIQLNDFGKIREQALAKSFKPSTDDNKYFSAKRTIGKKENIHTDRFSKKDPKVYVVSTFISEWDDNEIISTLQRLGYTESEVKNSTIAGAPKVTRIYQHRSGQHYVEFDIVNSSTGKTIKELKYKNK